MFESKEDACTAAEIAEFLQAELQGRNCAVYQGCSLDNMKDNSVIWLGKRAADRHYDLGQLDNFTEMLVILWDQFPGRPNCAHILSKEPRLDFVRVLNKFLVTHEKPGIHPTAVIEKGAVIGGNAIIGAHTYIGPKVRLGDNCRIYHNVSILGDVEMGSGCVVKSNAVIGSEGFSFVTGSNNLEHFPQTGRIVIGNNVWIGSASTVERAAIDATTIEDDVKIDDLVQIGHNTTIGRLSQITAGVVICGRARVGSGVWIAPNSTINNAVHVGDGAYVGLGAVVLKDVEPGTVVVGNPARFLKKREEIDGFDDRIL
jgi:UDP-3-O-[3-hydroxymyristoyl] glucosamine N-acyltransferase